MAKSGKRIRFKARLQQPAEPGRGAPWTFVLLPQSASSKLPARSMTSVDGAINGEPFLATLQPDGEGSHWLKVSARLSKEAGAVAGETVSVEMSPAEKEPEPKVPTDLRKALSATPEARAVWSEITTIQRRDWIHWIVSAKKAETRERRINNACDMLGTGKRRVCCFDRSGMYSKGLSAPKAVE